MPVERSRITTLFNQPWRQALVVAPPGFDKTAAVAAWLERSSSPSLWIELTTFPERGRVQTWDGLIDHATQPPAPTPSARAEREPATEVDVALVELAGALRRNGRPVTLVFDHGDEVDDARFWLDLAALVDRSGDALRTAVLARADPPVPKALWRAGGTLIEVRAPDLRLTGAEALEMARSLGASLPASEVARLNDAVDGWPLAFRLALENAADEATIAVSLLGAVVRGRDVPPLSVAAALAVADRLDADGVTALGGPAAGALARELARCGLVTADVADPDRLALDPVLRRLILSELRIDEPQRYSELHRAAATHARRLGDFVTAYRCSVEAGAADGEFIADPVITLVDQGDRGGADATLAGFPEPATIHDPRLAVEFAEAALYAGRVRMAASWIDRAEALKGAWTSGLRRDLELLRAQARLLQGDFRAALRHRSAAFAAPSRDDDVRVTRRASAAALTAARIDIAHGNPAGARRWLDELHTPPGTLDDIARDGLTCWCYLLYGHLRDFGVRTVPTLGKLERLGCRPHQVALDTMIVAAWGHLLGGEFPAANNYAALALDDADQLLCDWNLVRASTVAATTLLHLGGVSSARGLIAETRLRLNDASSRLAEDLELIEALALKSLGRYSAATDLLSTLVDRPVTRLRRAAVELASTGRIVTPDLLAGWGGWVGLERLEAGVLIAASAGNEEAMAVLVETACASGALTPFLAHGPAMDSILRRIPVERLYPALARHLRSPRATIQVATSIPAEALTAREHTILELLPSHLTYDQIAEGLSLSVNTVKSNLKSIYRKLAANSRAEAVSTARAAGLM